MNTEENVEQYKNMVEFGAQKFNEMVNQVPEIRLYNPYNMIGMGIKKDHLNKYAATDSNCKFCRKKCPLFSKNECFKKSVEEQQTCEYYSK